MPINCPVTIARLACDEMRRLDYQVMAQAFASQNELGRLCDESVYQADLVARLTAAGLGPVLFEEPIQVTHAGFTAVYKFLTLELIRDWGLFLEVALYCEAIIHFLGGFDHVVAQIPMSRNGIKLGNQEFLLAAPDAAFRVTAFTEHLDDHETHLRRLLRHSPLRALYWINMNHHVVQFVTLTKE